MNELALFAGAGGGLLGSRLLGWKTVCAVEIEPYCREVLLRRQRDGVLDLFPIWDDVRTFDGKPWRGIVDVITGGFPCQPFSVAGKKAGEADERNLWPETIRIIREVGPQFVLLENVPGLILDDYFGMVLGELAGAGFDAEWDVVSASKCGAPHKRARLWIVANTTSVSKRKSTNETITIATFRQARDESRDCREHSDAHGESPEWTAITWGECCCWKSEPELGRVADGVANRVDRLRAIGNGQVPLVAATAWGILTGAIE